MADDGCQGRDIDDRRFNGARRIEGADSRHRAGVTTMSADRKKGWHPDPFGRHLERYYYADDQPGRLVRDNEVESYDDLPSTSAVQDVVGVRRGARGTPGEPAAGAKKPNPTRPNRNTAADAEAMPGGPIFDDETVPWGTRMAQRFSEVSWPRLKMPHVGPRTTRKGGRPPFIVIGIVAAVVIAGVAIGLTVPGSGGPSHSSPPAGTQGTAPGSSTPTTVLPSTSWQVSANFSHTAVSITGISCPTAADCIAVGETSLLTGLALATTNGGADWHQQAIPKGVGGLDAISCASGSSCVAVGGSSVISTINGGESWVAQQLGSGQLTTIGCATTSTCVAAGTMAPGSGCLQGAAFGTSDGGATWTTKPLGCFEPRGLSCPDAGHCQLAGTNDTSTPGNAQVVATKDGGLSWTTDFHSSDSDTELTSISCPSTKICIAVGSLDGSSILASEDGGQTWADQTVPKAAGGVRATAVSCESNLVCQVVGPIGLATDSGGKKWSTSAFPPGVTGVDSVSCPLLVACFAGGAQASWGVILNYA